LRTSTSTKLGDVLLLAMSGGVKDAVMAKLDQFIFSEDVQLGDVTGTFAQIAIVGPEAAAVVASIVRGVSEDALRAMPEHGNARGEWAGGAAIVTRVADTGEPGFDLYVERAQTSALKAALSATGVMELDEATGEAIRVEAGVPLFGRDMDEETIPLEAGIESRAISFSRAATSGRRSSSGCCTAVTAGSRASWWADIGRRSGSACRHCGPQRRSRDRQRDEQYPRRLRESSRSRWPTFTAISRAGDNHDGRQPNRDGDGCSGVRSGFSRLTIRQRENPDLTPLSPASGS